MTADLFVDLCGVDSFAAADPADGVSACWS
jgi:hypothetical protein